MGFRSFRSLSLCFWCRWFSSVLCEWATKVFLCSVNTGLHPSTWPSNHEIITSRMHPFNLLFWRMVSRKLCGASDGEELSCIGHISLHVLTCKRVTTKHFIFCAVINNCRTIWAFKWSFPYVVCCWMEGKPVATAEVLVCICPNSKFLMWF